MHMLSQDYRKSRLISAGESIAAGRGVFDDFEQYGIVWRRPVSRSARSRSSSELHDCWQRRSAARWWYRLPGLRAAPGAGLCHTQCGTGGALRTLPLVVRSGMWHICSTLHCPS